MNPSRARPFLVAALFSIALSAIAARAADEAWKPVPRRIPPAGVKIDDAARTEIETGLAKLQARLKTAARDAKSGPLLADVQIYEKAVRYALLNGEFFKPEQAKTALGALKAANERLDALEKGQQPWADGRGQFVLGYTSPIDGSPQPYGVEVPEKLDPSKPARLYVWLHGRGETETDLYFIAGRTGRPGQIKPTDGIVIHPFGRQCIGYKSAGELDVIDAIRAAQSRFNIDPNRIVLMGFSMGGAGAWHVGAHFADLFAAVHAGAGFVDTVKFQHIPESDFPPKYTQTLWGAYDVPCYVHNLFNIPVITYGGEVDKQRAAGEIMVETYKAEGRELPMLVGPKMGHKYDPESLAKVMEFMKSALDKGRDSMPVKVSLQTRTLRYNKMYWVEATGLEKHWQDSRIDADASVTGKVVVTTRNVSALTLQPPFPTAAIGSAEVTIDGTVIKVAMADRWSFHKQGGRWLAGAAPATALRKSPALQGPIDDVVMAPFLVVTPSGKSSSPQVQQWVDFELAHFQNRWREVFRGDLRVKADADVTPEDIKQYHLILWGDAQSNKVIAQVLGKLPIQWTATDLTVAGQRRDAATHVPLMIYPNPLNPQKYVALNSGPTFRENDDNTNSQQNPKLGDWAVVDVTVPPDTKAPGKVVEAGFFDEQWRFGK